MNVSSEQIQNMSSCLVRSGSHEAKNMKDPCCVLLQVISCYRLPLEAYLLQEKIKTTFGFEQRQEKACVCECVLFFCCFFWPAGLR